MQFHFADLIKKYAVDCTLIYFAPGGYVAGESVPGARTDKDIRAALISMSQAKIYQSGGFLTSSDRTLYILKADDGIDLETGKWFIQHNGKKYKLEESGLYGEDYADFNEYTCRRVDKFDV